MLHKLPDVSHHEVAYNFTPRSYGTIVKMSNTPSNLISNVNNKKCTTSIIVGSNH